MDQTKDLLYCSHSLCTEGLRIIAPTDSQFEYFQKLHQHEDNTSIRKFTELQSELQLVAKAQDNSNTDYEELMTHIDVQIQRKIDDFQHNISKIKQLLQNYVSRHIISIKRIQQFYESYEITTDEDIQLLEENLTFLIAAPNQLKNQEDKIIQVRWNLDLSLNNIETIISNLTKQENLVLLEPQALVVPEIFVSHQAPLKFQWSATLKHSDIKVFESVAKNEKETASTIFLEPQMTLKSTKSIQIKINKIGNCCWLQLCDYNIVKLKRSRLDWIGKKGGGAYSLRNDGRTILKLFEVIYSHYQIPLDGICGFLKFTEGDIMKLSWEGPKKTFSITKQGSKDN